MNALCIGESCLEITGVLANPLKDGQIINIVERLENGAGVAGNVSYLLAKWGVETHIASMLGADDAADKIKKEYENIGVKTDYLETSYDKQTSTNLSLINNATKENTYIKIGSNLHLKKYSFVAEPDVIFLDGTDLTASTTALEKYPNAKSFLLVSNNNNDTQELCRYVNHIIFTKEAAESFTGNIMDFNDSGTLVNIYSKLCQKFNKALIIISLGIRGVLYAVNGQVKIMPNVKVDTIDLNGYNEIFSGAFVYGMGREFDLEKSITYATIAASFSIGKVTSRNSIPSLTEVSSYYDNKFGGQNNINNTNENNNSSDQVNNNTPKLNTVEEENVNK